MAQFPAVPIGGWQKQSFVDWPGQLATVLFTRGCNLRCPYCHNATLLSDKFLSVYPSEQVLSWIAQNRQLLDAVVVSGGEPTLHKELPLLMQWIKEAGFKAKLDTNGTNPVMLNDLLKHGWVDAVAMDIKAPLHFDAYKKVAGAHFTVKMWDAIQQSIIMLKDAAVEVHFRTTVAKPLLFPEDIIRLQEDLQSPVKVQNYQAGEGVLAPNGLQSWSAEELQAVQKAVVER